MPVHQKEVQSAPPATNRRTAWVLVIIMSALLILALLGAIWGFVRQARILMAANTTASVPAVAPAAAAVITLAPGARIVSATTDSGKLVLHVATPSGGEVEIIDLVTGKQTGQVKTAP
jgi:flagellar basal body-associated protein FliL